MTEREPCAVCSAGNGCKKHTQENPSDGMTRIRFYGYNLSPALSQGTPFSEICDK